MTEEISQFFEKLDFSKPLKPALEALKTKSDCPKCSLKAKMFCYKCKEFIPEKTTIPQFNLPVSLIVYKNLKEKDQKSTAWPL